MGYSDYDAKDPTEVAEELAETKGWYSHREESNQIAIEIIGQWQAHPITLSWSPDEELLRVISSFHFVSSASDLSGLHRLLNLINDKIWVGSFSHWKEPQLIVLKHGLLLSGYQPAEPQQIETLVKAFMASLNCYYPAFLLIGADAHETPERAMEIALPTGHGTA